MNQEGCHGRRPLHEASRLGRSALVTLLLGAGAQPDPRSHYGLTPLALAAQGGHLEVVETLLRRGESQGSLMFNSSMFLKEICLDLKEQGQVSIGRCVTLTLIKMDTTSPLPLAVQK